MEACLRMLLDSAMKKGTVKINFTIGFGNNLFQYCTGKLIADTFGLQLSHKGISEIGLSPSTAAEDSSLPTIYVDDANYKKVLYSSNVQDCNIVVNGYFEDYKIFKPHLKEIRESFSPVEITNTADVILHLRLQNRLVQEAHNKNHISAQSIKKVLQKFDFDKLHVVTDAEKWTHYDKYNIEKIQDQIRCGPNPNPAWVPTEQSIEYINHLIDGLSDLEPIIHCNGEDMLQGSGGLRSGFIDDFNLLRGFNQVIIHNSTFSWWAATLSGAQKVAIFNPWKIAKPPRMRRNLGRTDYDGWFSWGGKEALYFDHYGVEE